MEIRNPEYVLEIARQKSVTRAAEALYVTQSTLSQYLLKLESELGTPLFLRTKNELLPTEAGEMYLQAALEVVRLQNTLGENLSALKNEGNIRLGISSRWGVRMAVDLLPRFEKEFPNITLKLYETHSPRLRTMLMADRLDLAAVAAASPEDLLPLPLLQLRREELVLALPEDHPFCAGRAPGEPIPQEELSTGLRDVNFIFSDEYSTLRQMEDALFRRLLFRPNIVCELNSNSAALEMAARGVGAAFSPLDYVREVPGVRAFRLDPPFLRTDVLAFRRNLPDTPPLRLLRELIVSYPLFGEERKEKDGTDRQAL